MRAWFRAIAGNGFRKEGYLIRHAGRLPKLLEFLFRPFGDPWRRAPDDAVRRLPVHFSGRSGA